MMMNKLKCSAQDCEAIATAVCIVEEGIYSCDEHVVGDYFIELDEDGN